MFNSVSFTSREAAQQAAAEWSLSNWTVDKVGKLYYLRWRTVGGPQPAIKETD